jgi:hypothetical protein
MCFLLKPPISPIAPQVLEYWLTEANACSLGIGFQQPRASTGKGEKLLDRIHWQQCMAKRAGAPNPLD